MKWLLLLIPFTAMAQNKGHHEVWNGTRKVWVKAIDSLQAAKDTGVSVYKKGSGNRIKPLVAGFGTTITDGQDYIKIDMDPDSIVFAGGGLVNGANRGFTGYLPFKDTLANVIRIRTLWENNGNISFTGGADSTELVLSATPSFTTTSTETLSVLGRTRFRNHLRWYNASVGTKTLGMIYDGNNLYIGDSANGTTTPVMRIDDSLNSASIRAVPSRFSALKVDGTGIPNNATGSNAIWALRTTYGSDTTIDAVVKVEGVNHNTDPVSELAGFGTKFTIDTAGITGKSIGTDINMYRTSAATDAIMYNLVLGVHNEVTNPTNTGALQIWGGASGVVDTGRSATYGIHITSGTTGIGGGFTYPFMYRLPTTGALETGAVAYGIDSLGRVAIGSSIFSRELTIRKASAAAGIALQSTGGSGNNWGVVASTAGNLDIGNDAGGSNVSMRLNGAGKFLSISPLGSELFRFDSLGNFGAGDPSPQHTISISGTTSVPGLNLTSTTTNTTHNTAAEERDTSAANILMSASGKPYLTLTDHLGRDLASIDTIGRFTSGTESWPVILASIDTAMRLRLHQYGSAGTNIATISNGNGATAFRAFTHSGSVITSPGTTGASASILNIVAGGYDGSGWVNSKATIGLSTGSAWSSTSTPTKITFSTTPTGSTTQAERVRIDSSGNVGIGDAVPAHLLTVGNGDLWGVASDGSVIDNSGLFTGRDAFSGTATTDTVTISGAATTDNYSVQYYGTTVPTALDNINTIQPTATGFVLHRGAAGTSGLTYMWIRIR